MSSFEQKNDRELSEPEAAWQRRNCRDLIGNVAIVVIWEQANTKKTGQLSGAICKTRFLHN